MDLGEFGLRISFSKLEQRSSSLRFPKLYSQDANVCLNHYPKLTSGTQNWDLPIIKKDIVFDVITPDRSLDPEIPD